jgi:hypothetical protein
LGTAEKHENIENTTGVIPGCFSTISDVNTIIIIMKRE